MKPLMIAVWIVAGLGCSQEFYCQDSAGDDGIRYCFAKKSECEQPAGASGLVACTKRRDAYCRPDINEDRVCTQTKAECKDSVPAGMLEIRSGQKPTCEWVH